MAERTSPYDGVEDDYDGVEDDDDEMFAFQMGWSSNNWSHNSRAAVNRGPVHPHSRALTRAIYEYWSNDDEEGYKYLGEAYNEHVLKPGEQPLSVPEFNVWGFSRK